VVIASVVATTDGVASNPSDAATTDWGIPGTRAPDGEAKRTREATTTSPIDRCERGYAPTVPTRMTR
jgi:hypothetical protein